MRSPMRSPNQPTDGMGTVRVIMKPVSTHWMRFRDAPKEDMIVGIATLTAVTLKPTDRVPKKSVIETHHFRKLSTS